MSWDVYMESFLKILSPMFIPTIFIVGVSLIFNFTTLPAFEIRDISQYYSLTSYQTLENILGIWYNLFLISFIVYVIFVLYAICAISGMIVDGLKRGNISFDIGGRRGANGFAFSLIPFAILMLIAYYLASTYGKYYIAIPFVLGYLWNYTIASSIVDGSLIGKNVMLSMRATLKHPLYSMIAYIVPLAIVFVPTGAALYFSVSYFPAYTFIIAPMVALFFIPYSVIVNAIAYLSLRS